MKKNRILMNEHGYSLIIVVLTLAVTSIIGISLFTITNNTRNTTTNERIDQAVFYIAEAGLVETKAKLNITDKNPIIKNAIIETKEELKGQGISAETFSLQFNDIFLKKVLDDIQPFTDTVGQGEFESQVGANPFADITVTCEKVMDESDTYITELIYKIESIGNIDGKERSVTQNIKLSLGNSISLGSEKVVSGKEKVVVGTEDVIVGYEDVVVGTEEVSVVTEKVVSSTPQFAIQATNSFEVGNGANSSIIGCVALPDTVADKKDKGDPCGASVKLVDPATLNYKVPNTTGWSTSYTQGKPLTTNVSLTTLKLTTSDFTIDVGNQNITIVVDHLDFSSVSNFKVNGTGKLSIYVKDDISFNQHSSIGDTDQLKLFHFGDTLNFPNHLTFSGSLFVDKANISVNAGTNFVGNILAPNSSVTLNLGNKEALNGTIVAKDVNVKGGHVNYVANTIETTEKVVTKQTKEIIEKRPIIEKRNIIEERDIVEEHVTFPDEISIINVNSTVIEK